jgi:8-oxo-dGTP pyrophosphatase MutT (NUDIX family)
METTRHITATTYVVNDGTTALHEHERLGKWLPPGGHLDRDELPHESAVREVREEIGLEARLVADADDITSPTVRSLPQPHHVQLADVNVYDGHVGHQHVDLVYYGHVDSQAIDPADGEAPAEAWRWFTPKALGADVVDPDVTRIGRRAIEVVRKQERKRS